MVESVLFPVALETYRFSCLRCIAANYYRSFCGLSATGRHSPILINYYDAVVFLLENLGFWLFIIVMCTAQRQHCVVLFKYICLCFIVRFPQQWKKVSHIILHRYKGFLLQDFWIHVFRHWTVYISKFRCTLPPKIFQHSIPTAKNC